MREAFAHDAVIVLEDGGDERAPGGAITVALCGSWSHEPPCPLAPHHTRVHRTDDGSLAVRLLFAADPADEARVRALVEEVLARGWGDTPDGRTSWDLVESGPSPVSDDEQAHARRLLRG